MKLLILITIILTACGGDSPQDDSDTFDAETYDSDFESDSDIAPDADSDSDSDIDGDSDGDSDIDGDGDGDTDADGDSDSDGDTDGDGDSDESHDSDVISCPEGTELCGTECVELGTTEHCGSCFDECSGICEAGRCLRWTECLDSVVIAGRAYSGPCETVCTDRGLECSNECETPYGSAAIQIWRPGCGRTCSSDSEGLVAWINSDCSYLHSETTGSHTYRCCCE